ncbi:hypothetical protein EYM_01120 [Ignicoccus islandicus DSM 13165]|uniref:Uncharacterized protein n=1 Tax=Ignicoccus islandicus DSM 13165 TaxID=940295 RepID=A0A0U3ECK0_9CREN|nr:helicase C-terminal domain-containing protein [Ignicoccus islandicus]ALU12179.1 hypothetical protein EYM_01120 [Ignicoccus islandicus DSM 13165]
MLRPWQETFVKESLREISSKESVVIAIESPTGSGKTLTALKILERSLIEGYAKKGYFLVRTSTQVIPPIRDAEKFELKLQLMPLVGKEKSCPLGSSIVNMCKECPWRDRIAGPPVSWTKVFEWIESTKRSNKCPYMSMRRLIDNYDVVVMPYAYLTPSIANAMKFEVKDSILVFDEAHNVFNFMREEEIEVTSVKKLISKLPNFLRYVHERMGVHIDSESLIEVMKSLKRMLKELEAYQAISGKSVRVREIKDSIGPEISLLRKDLESIVSLLAFNSDPKYDIGEKVLSIIKALELLRERDTMAYYERGVLKIKELRPWISKYVDRVRGIILLSGTMPSKEFLERAIGRVDLYLSLFEMKSELEEYFKLYRPENVEVIIVTDYTSKYKVRYDLSMIKAREMVEEATFRLVDLLNGIGLLVYPSFSMLKAVKSDLLVTSKKTGVPLVFNERGRGSEVLNRAKALGKCVIAAVARDQLTEGIEITENGRSLIKVVSVIGAPYPLPSPFLEDVAKALGDKDGSVLWKLYEEEMLMRVKQAIGRLVRNPEDKGIVILADNRFSNFKNELGKYRKLHEVTASQLLQAVRSETSRRR